nr:ABC-type transport auxiliary lipoprotein family protein [Vibrio cidicii]
MMIRWLTVLLSVVMFGCSSNTQEHPINYFLLDNTFNTSALESHEKQTLLVVYPVTLSSHLDTPSIIYQTTDTQVVKAQRNQWADSLSNQITKKLVQSLRHSQERYWPIELSALVTQKKNKLQISLTKFNGTFSGDAEIQGEWTLFDTQNRLVINRSFLITVPLQEEGYRALVKALSTGVDLIGDEISTQLTTTKAKSETQTKG